MLAAGLLLLVSAPPGLAAAADSRGAATQDGWWNRLQGPPEGEPEPNPIRPLVPALPRPPNVPADAVAVSATAGQVDKVAAVGLDVALADGATLDGLVLRLVESTENGANVDAAKAKVIACPATVPWGPGQNATWKDRPAADCQLGVAEGRRGADGTWTFDLAALGRQWADPFAPLAPYGIVLSVDPAGSPSVQVSWLNVDSGNVAVELTATPGTPAPPPGGPDPSAPQPFAVGPDAASAPPSLPSRRAPTDTGAVLASGGSVSGDPSAGATGPPAGAVGPTTDTSESGAPAESPADATLSAASEPPGPVLRARPAVDFWESVPGPTVLLVPIAVGLAIVVGVALGPVGRPSPALRREGGLSRALARRNPAGRDCA